MRRHARRKRCCANDAQPGMVAMHAFLVMICVLAGICPSYLHHLVSTSAGRPTAQVALPCHPALLGFYAYLVPLAARRGWESHIHRREPSEQIEMDVTRQLGDERRGRDGERGQGCFPPPPPLPPPRQPSSSSAPGRRPEVGGQRGACVCARVRVQVRVQVSLSAACLCMWLLYGWHVRTVNIPAPPPPRQP